MNFVIGLCGLPILIQTLYPYTYEMCRSYLLPNTQPVEVIRTSQAEIDQEMAVASELALPRDQHEFYLVGRKLQQCLRQRDCLLVHGLALSITDVGYLLLGKSGAGKTTLGNHCVLTLQDCCIINGDKPFLRCQGNAITAYGTPWNGKEGYGENSKVTIAYLVFINQGAVNRCRVLTAEEAAFRILGQISVPTDAVDVKRVFSMVDQLLQYSTAVEYTCMNTPDAALDLVKTCRPER